MSGEPGITFIDRNGKATVVGPNFPRDGFPGIPVCDAAGNAVAIRAAVPRDARPCTGIAGPVAASLELEEYIPRIWIILTKDESRLDDWTCNAFSENFDSPPPASPPWTWGADVVFQDGGVAVDAFTGRHLNYNVASTWPYVMTSRFYWDQDFAGGGFYSLISLEALSGPWWWQTRSGAMDIDADFTNDNFVLRLSAYHEKVGVTGTGDIVFDPGNPYDLNGEVLSVSIWDGGKITVNFYGQNHDNGGSP